MWEERNYFLNETISVSFQDRNASKMPKVLKKKKKPVLPIKTQPTISEKQPNQKMGRPEQTFLQRGHPDGQETHEKMLNTAHY